LPPRWRIAVWRRRLDERTPDGEPAALLGDEAMVSLSEAFGGRRLYVPQDVAPITRSRGRSACSRPRGSPAVTRSPSSAFPWLASCAPGTTGRAIYPTAKSPLSWGSPRRASTSSSPAWIDRPPRVAASSFSASENRRHARVSGHATRPGQHLQPIVWVGEPWAATSPRDIRVATPQRSSACWGSRAASWTILPITAAPPSTALAALPEGRRPHRREPRRLRRLRPGHGRRHRWRRHPQPDDERRGLALLPLLLGSVPLRELPHADRRDAVRPGSERRREGGQQAPAAGDQFLHGAHRSHRSVDGRRSDRSTNLGGDGRGARASRLGHAGAREAFREAARARYRAIVAIDPRQAKFLKGWLARADELGVDA
jgi:hypothetical protein